MSLCLSAEMKKAFTGIARRITPEDTENKVFRATGFAKINSEQKAINYPFSAFFAVRAFLQPFLCFEVPMPLFFKIGFKQNNSRYRNCRAQKLLPFKGRFVYAEKPEKLY